MAAKVGGDDANRAFNGCLALTLRGELNAELLAAAWQVLTDRHEALRCAFTSDGQGLTVAGAPEHARPSRPSELGAEARARRVDSSSAPRWRRRSISSGRRSAGRRSSASSRGCTSWFLRPRGDLRRRVGGRAPARARRALPRGRLPLAGAAHAGGRRAGTGAVVRVVRLVASRPRGETRGGRRRGLLDRSGSRARSSRPDLPTDRPYPRADLRGSATRPAAGGRGSAEPLRRLGAEAGALRGHPDGGVSGWLARLTGQPDLIVGAAGRRSVGRACEAPAGHAVQVLPSARPSIRRPRSSGT